MGTWQKMLLFLSAVILFCCLLVMEPAVVSTWNGNRKTEKRLVLTFDCEGKEDHTDEILGILKTKNVPAVFFVTGEWMKENEESVKKIADARYEIGGHGVAHKDLEKADKKTCQQELKEMDEQIRSVTGKNMRLYRPAYNVSSETLAACAADYGVALVLYSLDTQDWKNYGADELVEGVCQSENLEDGAILWCHLNGKYTAQSLEPMIGKLQQKGYRFVGIN
ncbi:MAG: polysaccharide deacetylase family protein [Clostridiales bacterium]|nr:polysaccharide deacetylase family protein [Clostridiales bacterium]